MVILYHYTNRAGKDGIYADQMIRATDSHDGLGKVVRFTELPHDTDKPKLIENYWGRKPPFDASEKLRFWFKFDTADLPATTQKIETLKGRNIWVSPVDVPVQSTSRTPTAHQPSQSTPNGKTFYYYTDKKEMDIINKIGYIDTKPSRAFSSNVVKLTDLEPNSPKNELVWHAFGKRQVTPESEAKTKYWFKFDESELRDLKRATKANGRRIWTTPIAVYTKVKKQNPASFGQQSTRGSFRSYEKPSTNSSSYNTLPRSTRHSQESGPPVKKLANSWPPLASKGNEQSSSQAPPTIPVNQPHTLLYYYTNRDGKDKIFQKGRILAQNGRVLLSDRPPLPLTGTARTPPSDADSNDYWFEFRDIDLVGLSHTVDDQGVPMWVVDRDVELGVSTSQGRLSS